MPTSDDVIGYVVKHKESGVIYAIQTRQYNPNIHTKLRDMYRGESIRKYNPHTGDVPRPVGVRSDPSLTTPKLRMGMEFTLEGDMSGDLSDLLNGEAPKQEKDNKSKTEKKEK